MNFHLPQYLITQAHRWHILLGAICDIHEFEASKMAAGVS